MGPEWDFLGIIKNKYMEFLFLLHKVTVAKI